jgi:NAD(P)-dependent dehydrogenase (short-subunit alcohol dehydrogenase family)
MHSTGPTILITGAAKRIGRLIALHYAAKGWQVAVHYHASRDEAENLAKEAKGNITLFQADLSQPHMAENLFQDVVKKCGVPHLLINNACMFERDDGMGGTPEGRAAHHAVNVHAPVKLVTLQHAQANKVCVAINMLDATLAVSAAALGSYVESKKAFEEWTAAKASHFRPILRLYGIKLGPVMRNPRESQAHFDKAAATTRRKEPTPIPLILSTIEKLFGDTSYKEPVIHDLS